MGVRSLGGQAGTGLGPGLASTRQGSVSWAMTLADEMRHPAAWGIKLEEMINFDTVLQT